MRLDELDEPHLKELRSALERAVAGVCPPWLSERRQDIVQNAMLKVLKLLSVREGETTLAGSYIWKIAFSETANEIRRVRRRREDPMQPGSQAPPVPTADPEAAAVSRQIGEAIVACLKALIPSRRHPVALHLYGCGLTELATRLGYPRKRAENLLYRGLQDLRRCLEARGLRP